MGRGAGEQQHGSSAAPQPRLRSVAGTWEASGLKGWRVRGDFTVMELGEDLVVLTVEDPAGLRVGSTPSAMDLTVAEQEVARLAVRGLSNEHIARARGSRARTVANQLATVYRKLGVSGRRELRARLRETAAP